MQFIDISPRATMSIDLLLSGVDVSPFTPSVFALRARASAAALAPTVTGVRHATVNAVPALSTAVARTPVVNGSNVGIALAPRSTSSTTMHTPVVSGSALVTVGVAGSTTFARVPTADSSVPVSDDVVAVVAASTSTAPAPAGIIGEAVLSGGGPGTSTAQAIAPTVSAGSGAAAAFSSVGAMYPFSNSTAVNLPVPAGVTGGTGQIVLAFLYVEVGQTVTPPAGFTEVTASPVACTGSFAHFLHIYWKRPTVADSGTYNFTIAAGLAGAAGFAALFTGCVASGNPIGSTNAAFETDATPTDGFTPAVIINPTSGTNRLLVWAITDFSGSTPTTFSGAFVKRADIEVGMATLPQPAVGSTGSLVATTAFNVTRSAAWLGELLPA